MLGLIIEGAKKAPLKLHPGRVIEGAAATYCD